MNKLKQLLSWEIPKGQDAPTLSDIPADIRAILSRAPWKALLSEGSVDLAKVLRQRKVLVYLLESGVINVVDGSILLTDKYQVISESDPAAEIKELKDFVKSIDPTLLANAALTLLPPAWFTGYADISNISLTADQTAEPLRSILEKLRPYHTESVVSNIIGNLTVKAEELLKTEYRAELLNRLGIDYQDAELLYASVHMPTRMNDPSEWDLQLGAGVQNRERENGTL